MRLLISKFLALLFISVPFLGAEMFSRTKVALGTFVTISLPLKDKHFIEDGFSIIHAVELSLSSYNSQAKIYQLNENKYIDLDAYTYEALMLSRKYFRKSDGYFNIAIGSVTKDLYKFGEEEKTPSNDILMQSNVNYRSLYFSKKEAFLREGIKVDLGGMGKGYAVDKVTEYFESKGMKKAVIAASGDIRCLDTCKIEVENPFSQDSLATFTTQLPNMGISTSGNYNRYVQSTKHNHLINPKLKKSQINFVSVTLVSKLSNSDLDAYATAASVMPLDKAYVFLNGLNLGYIVMESDKTVKISENLNAFTKNLVFNDGMKK